MINENEIEIDAFEERVFDLSGIGLSDFEICFEKDGTYLMGATMYLPILNNDFAAICRKMGDDNYKLSDEDGHYLVITNKQYSIILDIFNTNIVI